MILSAKIGTSQGAGGFLNPPTHPEHTVCVLTRGARRSDPGFMSLSCAAECDYITPATRTKAQRILDEWQPLPVDHPEVQEWVLQVLGYFRNCYRGYGAEPECWHVRRLHMLGAKDPVPSADDHAGVHFIRKFYPGYAPTDEDFKNAYWGTKPTEED